MAVSNLIYDIDRKQQKLISTSIKLKHHTQLFLIFIKNYHPEIVEKNHDLIDKIDNLCKSWQDILFSKDGDIKND